MTLKIDNILFIWSDFGLPVGRKSLAMASKVASSKCEMETNTVSETTIGFTKEKLVSNGDDQTYQFTWIISQFKNWHNSKPGAYVDSSVITVPIGDKKRQCSFKFRLISYGMDLATGRVHFNVQVWIKSKKWFQMVPIEMKTSIIDKEGIKQLNQGRNFYKLTKYKKNICFPCFQSFRWSQSRFLD